jgi:hypothetical protein
MRYIGTRVAVHEEHACQAILLFCARRVLPRADLRPVGFVVVVNVNIVVVISTSVNSVAAATGRFRSER